MKKVTYEERIRRIEEIIQKIESNEPTMEESVALFEEGIKLVHSCEEELEKTQQKVVKLVEGNGVYKKEPISEVDA